MAKRLGVIDIGTNTFHLLVVDWNQQTTKFETVIRKRIFVKLGAKNLAHISLDAYQRGIKALATFKEILQANNCTQYIAFGTAAIRNASNADQFITEVNDKLSIKIQKISGDKEAHLIYQGIKLSYPFDDQPCLIMDIGGGSVEFIIANNHQVFYAESFLVGAAVLRNQFHQTEPISKQEIRALHLHLDTHLATLKEQLQKHNPHSLIGASGTFDILQNEFSTKELTPTSSALDTDNLTAFFKDIASKNLEQRLATKEIPTTRADLIVVALLLIEHILQMHHFDQVVVTQYAMKEGMLREMMQDKH